jgi:Fe-S-cluster containining protein
VDRNVGDFDEWLAGMRAVLRGEALADVPCAGCVGCCVSSYPIPLRPADRVALEQVPDRYLQFRPADVARMLHRDDGTCPMLAAGRCSIYADRPQTCRDYDCRMLAAAGVEAGDGRDAINERVRAWAFTYEGEADRRAHDAVRAAAAFIRDERASFPGGAAPSAPDQIAVLALKIYELFLDGPPGTAVETANAIVRLTRSLKPEALTLPSDRRSWWQTRSAPAHPR